MSTDEITVHADHSMKSANKITIVMSLGLVAALIAVGRLWGQMDARMHTIENDQASIRVEFRTELSQLERKDAVALMFGDVRARLTRIEALLDRFPTSR
jgi:hypothetical protein